MLSAPLTALAAPEHAEARPGAVTCENLLLGLGLRHEAFAKYAQLTTGIFDLFKGETERLLDSVPARKRARLEKILAEAKPDPKVNGRTAGLYEPGEQRITLNPDLNGKVLGLLTLVHELDHAAFDVKSPMPFWAKPIARIFVDPRSFVWRMEWRAYSTEHAFARGIGNLPEAQQGDLARLVIEEAQVPAEFQDLVFEVLSTAKTVSGKHDIVFDESAFERAGAKEALKKELMSYLDRILDAGFRHMILARDRGRHSYVLNNLKHYDEQIAQEYMAKMFSYGIMAIAIAVVYAQLNKDDSQLKDNGGPPLTPSDPPANVPVYTEPKVHVHGSFQ